ncbi:MAG: transglycosylase domain-containing protein [Alphaproteobacteria bacterium]|nr:transglycosylase domain-containing protein [Alphaproteobacteria bacterium]
MSTTSHTTPSWYSRHRKTIYKALAGTLLVGAPIVFEGWRSPLQSWYFNGVASGRFNTQKIDDPRQFPPARGPLDVRRGYANFQDYDRHLTEKGKWALTYAAPWYDRNILGLQLNLMDVEKPQAGALIKDDTGNVLYEAKFPRHVYQSFDDIPPSLIKALLFVENAELLEKHPERQNPAVEWDRFTYASLMQLMKAVGLKGDYPGASTAAVQKEKYKYSAGGYTGRGLDGIFEKFQQMGSATTRAYKSDVNTVVGRREIALDYINSLPLSSYPKQGDVEGFGDGMMLWFGRDFAELNHLLRTPEDKMSEAEMAEAGQAFREAFYIALSIKKPSDYLLKDKGRAELNDRVDKLLPYLAKTGVISERLSKAALAAQLEFTKADETKDLMAIPHNKTVNSLRTEFMNAIGVQCGLYCLDRLDATAITTVNKKASEDVTNFIQGLHDPENAKKAGLIGYQLLREDGLQDIVYSVALYEAGAEANYLRIQTDTYQGALNLNEGSKLQLGSTAKLRTLVSYLESIAYLHDKFSDKSADDLKALSGQYTDKLSSWALNYLIEQKNTPEADLGLRAMLDASMERTYSANPGETFFTGGGIHRFNNFKSDENGRVPTVRESIQNSHNLPFVRIMRDVINFTMAHKMNVPDDIYTNPDSLERKKYLTQFINTEGEKFLFRAWSEQNGKDRDQLFDVLVNKNQKRPAKQMAVIYRLLYPEAPVEAMAAKIHEATYRQTVQQTSDQTDDEYKASIAAYVSDKIADEKTTKAIKGMYDMYAPGKFNLNDLGYLTKIHPLAIWMAQQNLKQDPPTWAKAAEAARKFDDHGQSVMTEVYSWLLKPSKMAAQNKRIRTTLEEVAFSHLYTTWKKNGFSFDRMVPSLGSALGDSGDTPAALAEFSGIIANGGIRKPSIRFTNLTLAPDTNERQRKYKRVAGPSQRVMPEEVADVALAAMQGVVQKGTARRIGTLTLDDGRVLNIGGKTGTGDNRDKVFAKGGGLRSSAVKNRTATFVFEIDDPQSGKRFFGTILAYVEGPAAANHKFTSAVPTQITKNLVHILKPYLNEAYGATKPAPQSTPVPAGKTAVFSTLPPFKSAPSLQLHFNHYPLPALPTMPLIFEQAPALSYGDVANNWDSLVKRRIGPGPQ